jgi:hypothetical protein
MSELFKQGLTLQSIGDRYGITRERVRQCLKMCFNYTKANNYHRCNTGMLHKYLAAKDRLAAHRKHEQERIHEIFGCHKEILEAMNGRPWGWTKEARYRCIAGEYFNQRRSAARRGVAWEISLPEWWGIWRSSGKYRLRGVGSGYVMARWGDSGSYSVDNVRICTASENIREYYFLLDFITCPVCGRTRRKIKTHNKHGVCPHCLVRKCGINYLSSHPEYQQAASA